MSNKVVSITSPSGNNFPVNNADEGARFMYILSNGFLDIPVDELKDKLESGDDVEHTFGGWQISAGDAKEEEKTSEYKLTKGDTEEIVRSLEGIAHVCDCAINTVVKRLEKNPEGFTVKGWTVALVK